MKILFVIPGDINLPTGGYRYDKEIIRAWQSSGYKVELLQLVGNYPFPSDTEKLAAMNQLTDLATFDIAVVDGLAGGAHPEFVAGLSQLIPVIALVHHPLCLENGLTQTQAQRLKSSEAQSLQHAATIVTTSPTTKKTVQELFQVAGHRVSSVLPGVERMPVSSPAQSGKVNLLCVGSIIERKGHRILIEALAELKHLDWQLDCVGSVALDPNLFNQLEALITTADLADRITFYGAVKRTELEQFYKQAHVFVLASSYEGYGMSYAEAIVAGLPVIGTTGGAIPDTVPNRCGMLVEPGNAGELQDAIRLMINQPQIREACRTAANQARGEFPDWNSSAVEFVNILKGVLNSRGVQ